MAGPEDASTAGGLHIPLTIPQWRAAQVSGGGLERLCALLEAERSANTSTRAWIALAATEQLEKQWRDLQRRCKDPACFPLYGVPFAAKDNIDAEGFVTTAACPAFATGFASCDAPVVANLKAAGAILIGKTNLDQFATGLVGTRSPHGAVPNSFDPLRVSGGSSSGSAVVVARGAVPFSLGTDTAGSGRVPAGLNNIVGLKPTRGALSARGVVPACRTLDCVSIFALTVDDAECVLSVAECYDAHDSYSRRRPETGSAQSDKGFVCSSSENARPSLAVCASPEWFGRGDHYPAYETALEKAKSVGWDIQYVNFEPLFQLAQLLYSGPWVAERYQAIRSFIQDSAPEAMDPVVRGIIMAAEGFTAADAFAGEYKRQDLTREIETAMAKFDGILVPTSPTFPTLEQVAQNPVEENSRLGTYTNFVNFLDWSALSVPAGLRPDGLPFGITLISSRWQEHQLLRWARHWFAGETRLLGATSSEFCEPKITIDGGSSRAAVGWTSLAVVGAHLSGFPLNKDLVSRGATISRSTMTSSMYKLFSLESESGPARPGLKRMLSGQDGAEVEVEVWDLPETALASFIETIPSPLSIGKIELSDESWVTGFVCEPYGLVDATDITAYGGWRAYRAHVDNPTSTRKGSISRILIANRGEIALRIIKTLHMMGFKAVAIYSETDAKAPHVRNADIALQLKGTSVSDTYLNIRQILDLAKSSDVDAVIPGYGFLAESAEFATAVQEAGMTWIGPTPHQMSELGLKHRARAIAAEAGVPTIPGCRGLLTSLQEALAEAENVGYPLMLKSTAGGGGIGLGHCKDAEDLKRVFEGVQRQAAANFGNGGVFLERFVERARHIEVQVLGDGAGRVVTVGERDCSLQRRHQKVVEESPATMVPETVRLEMKAAAVRLAAHVKYRNVGTVEFIYDLDSHKFYFLEVNTRLQVEHPVTEAVASLDLVECMVKVASGQAHHLFDETIKHISTSGASIEVRLYAESPAEQFRPCSGQISGLKFPSTLRVDSWIEEGTVVTLSFDPLLAKLIATGVNRHEALQNLAEGLAATSIDGIQTNLEYLRQIVASEMFESGNFTTKSLDSFKFTSSSFEVLEPGALTSVQDYPGRTGYWSVGIPPSGPADNLSLRLANRLVSNAEDAAGLECTLQGPSLLFHCETVIAVTGGEVSLTLDDEQVPMYKALRISPGQVLRMGPAINGYRFYLAIHGGIQVPKIMGSRSTFELGKLGGFNGRKLKAPDVLAIGPIDTPVTQLSSCPSIPIPQQPNAHWTVRVLPGPHGAPDHFTPSSINCLFSSAWKVHHNSNRLGVRLTGPRPEWARSTGGKAGLHPSNIHDSPYSVGSVSFTGDEAVVLTCDGPSLGGFVVFCVVASADLWKLGQVRPGDSVHFHAISFHDALKIEEEQNHAVQNLEFSSQIIGGDTNSTLSVSNEDILHVVLSQTNHNGHQYVFRTAGDRAILLELDGAKDFSLPQSFEIFEFCEKHRRQPIPGVEELTPGVCTIHIIYERGLPPAVMVDRITNHLKSFQTRTTVPSRTFRLPLAFDDEVCRAAVRRYAATIRDEAPWLPSNVEFLEKLNDMKDVSSLLHSADFLVVGLGDVFMGSPCAVPLDPRHRLFGTKYNPSRSFTPRGAVAIGGQYLCIYATESPGGYQLVGRTKDIWNRDLISATELDSSGVASRSTPWLFRLFDRITFYSVSEAELDSKSAEELIQVSEGELDLEQYEATLRDNEQDILTHQSHREDAIANVPFLEELLRPYQPKEKAVERVSVLNLDMDNDPGRLIKAMIPGRCYKVNVKEGDVVNKDDVLICLESSKMEIEIRSPRSGRCAAVLVESGDLVNANDDMIVLDRS